MRFEKVLITPTMAQKFLDNNPMNRRLSQPTISTYKNEMLDGRWKEDTAECIKITKEGKIIDGQHRLTAIVKAKCSVNMHVAFDMEESVFDVLDTGKMRNATDCFKIAGIKKENTLPSIIATYNALAKGISVRGGQKDGKATNAKLLNQYYEDELFWNNAATIAYTGYLHFAKILTPSLIGGMYAHLSELNKSKAEDFITQLTTGLNIQNNTIHLLRNKLMQDKMSLRKMQPSLKVAFIIKTWNAFVKNQTFKILKFDASKESYPIAIKN